MCFYTASSLHGPFAALQPFHGLLNGILVKCVKKQSAHLPVASVPMLACPFQLLPSRSQWLLLYNHSPFSMTFTAQNTHHQRITTSMDVPWITALLRLPWITSFTSAQPSVDHNLQSIRASSFPQWFSAVQFQWWQCTVHSISQCAVQSGTGVPPPFAQTLPATAIRHGPRQQHGVGRDGSPRGLVA